MRSTVSIVCAALMLSACKENPTTSDTPTATNVQLVAEERAAVEPVEAPVLQPLTFGGNECTEDCSGHEAGYAWAEDNDISDPDECTGNSDSFIEGCESYVEDSADSYEPDPADYLDRY